MGLSEEGQIQSLGKYRVLGILGRGSMGIVYKAQDPEIGRVVAIKTLRKITTQYFADAESALERFRIEARSAGNLRHPNIITVFEVNIEGDTPYIVMDFVEGKSLAVILQKEKMLAPAAAINYLEQIASGLDYAHEKGVIHRDIKPSNLIVDENNRAYIVDFGVAKINASLMEAEKVLRPEPVMGTPSYMSPEQILNEELTPKSDLFSLAVTSYELLTGSKPFVGDTFNDLVAKILKSPPTPLTSVVPELPLALEAEFEKALAKKPEDRFSCAAEMILAFKKALGIGEKHQPALHKKSKRQRKDSDWDTLSDENKKDSPLSKSPVIPLGDDEPSSVVSPWKGYDEFKRGPGYFDAPSSRYKSSGPGQMFDSAESVYSAVVREKAFSVKRVFILLLGILMILTSIALIAYQLNPSFFAFLNTQAKTEDKGPVVFPGDIEGADLKLPKGVAPPPNKPVAKMSNEELYGVIEGIGNTNYPERVVVDALYEAKKRSVAFLTELAIAAADNDSYLVRIEAIKILGDLKDKRAIGKLINKLDDYDPLVRAHAAKALGKIGSRRAVPYLTIKYRTESSEAVKRTIKKAIEKINGYPFKG